MILRGEFLWYKIYNILSNFYMDSKKYNHSIQEKQIYDLLTKSATLDIAVKGYTSNEPIIIQSNLKGFSAASKKLNS